MMFAWTNSYNKRVRFQCAIGGYVMVCGNGMCTGDMMSFSRKHSGTANHDAKMQISNQIKHAEKFFKRIITDRNDMKIVPLLKQQQAELIGRLYCNELLGSQQISIVKQEMNNPTYAYGSDAENCWTFYNHVTHALKKSHPRTWLSNLQKFHEFMVADVLGTMGLKQIDTTNLTQEHLADEEFHDIKADEALESEVEPIWETLEEEDTEDWIDKLRKEVRANENDRTK